MRLRLDRWLWGCPVILAIWVACIVLVAPRIEDHLRAAVQRAEEGGPASPLRGLGAHAEIAGRDVVIVADLGLPADVKWRAEREAAAIPGVRHVRTEITTPVEMTPFPLVLTRRGSRLVITGGVPSAAFHAAFLERVYASMPADTVDDRLRLGRGEPPGFPEAARFILDAVLRLPQAEGALTDRVFTFKGTAARPQEYNDVVTLLAKPPAGYAPGLVDIRPPLVSPYVWSAVKTPDALVLEGDVPSEADRHELIGAAHSSAGVSDVVDRMQTAGGLQSGLDFLALARASVAALGRVGAGRADLKETRFSFTGNVVARDQFASLEGALRRELPGGFDVGPITIGMAPASPFVFTARRGGGRLTLAGYAPDEAERTAILDEARRRFAGEDIVDRLHDADGAPGGFRDAAGLALDRLADLAEGEARISDRTLRLTGRSLYAQLAERLRTTIASAVPPGWVGTAAIETTPAAPPLDAARCSDLLDDVVRRQPIRFAPGAKEPSAASASAVDSLAAVLRRCGNAQVEIGDRISASADRDGALALAKARAEALARALGAGNVGARLTSRGLAEAEEKTPGKDVAAPQTSHAAAGKSEPAESRDAGPAAAPPAADRIEFTVRP